MNVEMRATLCDPLPRGGGGRAALLLSVCQCNPPGPSENFFEGGFSFHLNGHSVSENFFYRSRVFHFWVPPHLRNCLALPVRDPVVQKNFTSLAVHLFQVEPQLP